MAGSLARVWLGTLEGWKPSGRWSPSVLLTSSRQGRQEAQSRAVPGQHGEREPGSDPWPAVGFAQRVSLGYFETSAFPC